MIYSPPNKIWRKSLIGFLISLFVFGSFFVSCGIQKRNLDKDEEHLYDIIEKVNYGEDGLYFKTLSFEELPESHLFSYNNINLGNVRFNSITEIERFVNFDTIFNPKQREEIDNRLKNLKVIKLNSSHFSNPKVLSKVRSSFGTPMEKFKGHSSISFPFIFNGKNGEPYGFIYRNDGLFYIYKREKNNWEEFARLEIHTVN